MKILNTRPKPIQFDPRKVARIILWLKVLEHFEEHINWDGISESARAEYERVRDTVPLDDEMVGLYRAAKACQVHHAKAHAGMLDETTLRILAAAR